ncbi:aldose epimerase family protein [Mongoliibacter ruber]|uniref:Aldose 1-epimerase n=1 Tax=Mongoliibacter ruber TaxID=1750599 RepID=A0A2T0WFJ6_9BACT|nr:aldose epimerase family protein [Mongoliibacter ruber]PRY85435.1 aldose 1-epimerase [Mongoliibacter ruber]
MKPTLTSKPFGKLPNGAEISIFTLSISEKISLSVMNYGATWTHLFIPDRNGKLEDVLLGFDTLEGFLQKDYLDNYCYLGATVGRVAGRATGNQFTLEGKTYHLPPNQGATHLHGGIEGWDKKVWSFTTEETDTAASVTFSYKSPDGEENYPGTVDIQVTYKLDLTGKLTISYLASTDSKTVLNPTNHFYINLSGNFQSTIEDHLFQVNAETFLPMNDKSLPTGELKSVEDTIFDFRTPKIIKEALASGDAQINLAGGIDHCFVLGNEEESAILSDAKSGRVFKVLTTSPGLQVYTGNYLSGSFIGKENIAYGKRSAICLETQFFPDSHNHDHFPSIVLERGNTFESSTSFLFETLS